MARRKRAGRALAMHAERPPPAFDLVLLHLGDVVGDVVEQAHLQRFPRAAEELGEDLAGLPHQQLPVRPGVVRGATHRPEILLALGAMDRGTGQLPVGQLDAVLGRDFSQRQQRVVAHLIAQPARAGVDHHADEVFFEAHRVGGRFVEDFVDHLDFEKMVARAERAALVAAAFQGPFG